MLKGACTLPTSPCDIHTSSWNVKAFLTWRMLYLWQRGGEGGKRDGLLGLKPKDTRWASKARNSSSCVCQQNEKLKTRCIAKLLLKSLLIFQVTNIKQEIDLHLKVSKIKKCERKGGKERSLLNQPCSKCSIIWPECVPAFPPYFYTINWVSFQMVQVPRLLATHRYLSCGWWGSMWNNFNYRTLCKQGVCLFPNPECFMFWCPMNSFLWEFYCQIRIRTISTSRSPLACKL